MLMLEGVGAALPPVRGVGVGVGVGANDTGLMLGGPGVFDILWLWR
jgi:hypothetical protein